MPAPATVGPSPWQPILPLRWACCRFGNRVPNGVRVFFSTLAIADDLISIAAIAIFYGQSPNPFWLGAAALVTCALVWLNKTQHYRLAPYSVLGLLLWFCMFKSGVHATLAGVILAFTIPAKCGVKLDSLTDWLGECLPLLDDRYDDEAHILGQHDFTVSTTKVERVMHRVTPPLIRMERLISTPVNFVILPIFAFVNAQVRLVGVDMSTLLTDPVTLGVYFGMLLGKPIGIFGMTFTLVKLKACQLPRNVNWHMIAGVAFWAASALRCRSSSAALPSRRPSLRFLPPRLPFLPVRSPRPCSA